MKKVRPWLENSFWILLVIISLLPKHLDKSVGLPMLYVVLGIVWVLAADSLRILYLAIKHRKNFYWEYRESKKAHLFAQRMFLQGALWWKDRSEEEGVPTAEEIDVAMKKAMDDVLETQEGVQVENNIDHSAEVETKDLVNP